MLLKYTRDVTCNSHGADLDRYHTPPVKVVPTILYYLRSITRGSGQNHQDTNQVARRPHLWVPEEGPPAQSAIQMVSIWVQIVVQPSLWSPDSDPAADWHSAIMHSRRLPRARHVGRQSGLNSEKREDDRHNVKRVMVVLSLDPVRCWPVCMNAQIRWYIGCLYRPSVEISGPSCVHWQLRAFGDCSSGEGTRNNRLDTTIIISHFNRPQTELLLVKLTKIVQGRTNLFTHLFGSST